MEQERASSAEGRWIGLREVAHISDLSRLGLTDPELGQLAAQLDLIVEAVAKLSGADVSEVDPTTQASGLSNVRRADLPEPSLSPEEALANAAAKTAGLIRVPAIQ